MKKLSSTELFNIFSQQDHEVFADNGMVQEVDNDASGGEREGELKSHGLKNGIFFFLKSEWLGSNFFFKMDSIPIMKVLQPQRPSGSTAEIFII